MNIKLSSLGRLLLMVLVIGAVFLYWPWQSGRIRADDDRSTPAEALPDDASIRPSSSLHGGTGSNVIQPVTQSTISEAGNGQLGQVQKLRPATVNDDGESYPVRAYTSLAMPNDPSASQWWVSQSRMDQAWETPAGPGQTVLAIIDTGFGLDHEEFDNRWFINAGESGATDVEALSVYNCTTRNLPLTAACNLIDDDGDGIVDDEIGAVVYENPSRLNCTDQGKPLNKSCNQMDDDGNEYVDDVSGWDFANGDNMPQAGEINPVGEGTTHGTRVAGIAAATGNNGKGIAGTDWQTRILPLQALDDDDYGDSLGVARSIEYAVAMGADVISISLGSDGPDGYVRNAMQAALAAGIPVVAAAGNDGCDCMVYPAAYPEAFAVGALDSSSQPAGFSSYGANLDILAPGTNMSSTNWQSGNRSSSYVTGIAGTSFATPLVAGLLSRIKSQQPAATPAQLIAAVTESVNRLNLPAMPITDPRYGFGTVDAGKAAKRMTIPRSGQILYAFSPVSRGGTLSPNNPAEPAGNAFAYTCEDGAWPSTRVHELVKGSLQFYTFSQVEQHKASQSGFTSNLLFYACLRQPHDSGSTMRNLNIYKEFRNLDYKGMMGM